MYSPHRPFFGFVCIAFGILLLIVALGDLLFRIILGIFALGLINYGFTLMNVPTMTIIRRTWFFRR